MRAGTGYRWRRRGRRGCAGAWVPAPRARVVKEPSRVADGDLHMARMRITAAIRPPQPRGVRLPLPTHDAAVADDVLHARLAAENARPQPLRKRVRIESPARVVREIARRDDATALAGIVI